ncbi:MAG TPA: PEP-CTERM sorting domain-containing protein [Rhizomicrobium sp.]|nr:PEP-CTERM sorting domain-containing protein [Rhizomicrobium sp.]
MKSRITGRIKAALLGAASLGAVCLGAQSASADAVAVYVGYVDNLRASGFFPSPWLTDSGVVSQTPDGQSLDAGAVRIDNLTGSPITIEDFQITLSGGGTFTIWSDLVIPAGGKGIFTQTASYNFDSSDFGMFGGFPPDSLAPNNYLGNGNTSLIGGCSSSPSLIASAGYTAACAATQPIISFKIGSDTFSFNDTGHILDTGQWDFVNNGFYGEDGNESINWNLIGAPPDRGGTTGAPEPLTLSLLGAGLAGMTLRRRKSK